MNPDSTRSRSELIEVIRNIPLFASLSKADVREVTKLCFEKHYDKDDVIVRQLEDAQLMVTLISGRARVIRDGKTLATVGPGHSVGEMGLIDGHHRSASVIAETPIEAIVLHRTAFLKLLGGNPAIVRKLLMIQTSRLRDADKKLSALG